LHVKATIAAAFCAALFAGIAAAQEQSENDRGPQRRRGEPFVDGGGPPDGPRRPPDGRPGFGPGPADPIEPSEAEFRDAEKAMRKHAPNWWRRFDNAPAGAPMHRRMMRAVIERHNELERIAQRDPEQHKREIKQLELEDDVLGLAQRIWRDREGSGGEVEALKTELHKKLGELVDLRLRNREARLQRLSDTLAAEKRRLEADQRNRDKTVDQRYEAALNRRLDQVFPGGRGPRGGGVGGGPDGPAVLGPPPSPDQPPPPRGPRSDRRERDERRRGEEDVDRGPRPPPPPPGALPPEE
jgi:hypothetical protein